MKKLLKWPGSLAVPVLTEAWNYPVTRMALLLIATFPAAFLLEGWWNFLVDLTGRPEIGYTAALKFALVLAAGVWFVSTRPGEIFLVWVLMMGGVLWLIVAGALGISLKLTCASMFVPTTIFEGKTYFLFVPILWVQKNFPGSSFYSAGGP